MDQIADRPDGAYRCGKCGGLGHNARRHKGEDLVQRVFPHAMTPFAPADRQPPPNVMQPAWEPEPLLDAPPEPEPPATVAATVLNPEEVFDQGFLEEADVEYERVRNYAHGRAPIEAPTDLGPWFDCRAGDPWCHCAGGAVCTASKGQGGSAAR